MAKKSGAKQGRKVDVYERVTTQIVEKLEAGVVPWHQPWTDGLAMPRSMATGKNYRGINLWVLAAEARTSAWWGTYRQIGELGGQVRKGERGTTVMFWKRIACDHGVESGRCDVGECKGPRVFARGFVVFNAEQADGLPEKYAKPVEAGREHEPLDVAEEIVSGYVGGKSGPRLTHDGVGAFYSKSTDVVNVPNAEAFKSGDAYYSTMFHELTHSTGHASRLARKNLLDAHRFGDESYSREELTAEMGAAFLSAICGIEQATLDASAAYLDNWMKALRGDHKLLTDAAAAAQKAVDMISGLEVPGAKTDTKTESRGASSVSAAA